MRVSCPDEMIHAQALCKGCRESGQSLPGVGQPGGFPHGYPGACSPAATLSPARSASAPRSSEMTPGSILARQLQSREFVSIQSATDMIQLQKRQDTRAPTRLIPNANPRTDEFERFLRHAQSHEAGGEALSLKSWLHLAEAWRITQALQDCRGNRSAAARVLGIGRRTLYAKMEKLGITATWGV